MPVKTTEERIAELEAHLIRRDDVYALWKARVPGKEIMEKYDISAPYVSKMVAEAKQAEKNKLQNQD